MTWWRTPYFLVPAGLLGGTLVGAGIAHMFGRDPAAKIWKRMHVVGPDEYASRIGRTDLLFPAESWASNRDVGVGFDTSVRTVQPNAWKMIAQVADDLDLETIYFTSMYRATGTGPHTRGRALDIGYVQRRGDPALTLLRRVDWQPVLEPPLAQELRLALVRRGATQVLTPWWIYSEGTRDEPNDEHSPLDVEHESHLHITVEAA